MTAINPAPPPPPQGYVGPTLNIKLPQLDELGAMVRAILEGRVEQAWYTLEQAWRLKFAGRAGEEGAISLQTLRNELALQPKGGKPDGFISNRRVWSGPSIEEWLPIDDEGLEAYLATYAPLRRVPERIRAGLEKRGS